VLATKRHGEFDADRTPLLIAHGLYGSGRNWGVIARNLSADRPVLTVDMRNHGDSPWTDSHTYPDMAADLAEVIAAHGGRADLLGHSMGGKAAMMLALTEPGLVDRLIVADIAPVGYGHSQLVYLQAMRAIDLEQVESRRDADLQLRDRVPELAVRAFLLQSLDVAGKRWRLNLDTLEREMDRIMDFPSIDAVFEGACMFLTGGASNYVRPEHRATIRALFPKSRMVSLPGANHWLHAEKPRDFEAAVATFLERAA